MKFSNVAEAFNFYRTQPIEALQKRAAAIADEIDKNADADIASLNIELRGIKEARENVETRAELQKTLSSLSLVEGAQMKPQEKPVEFDAATVAGTKEYRSAFFKSLLGQKLNEVETRAFNVATGAETRASGINSSSIVAAVLPTDTLNEVIKKARAMGGLLAEARAFSMPTKIAIPVGTPATAASWHTEGLPVESEQLVIEPVTFDGYEILKVFSISAKVRSMSIVAFEAYLVDELTSCVMETLDNALVNGAGTSQGTGLEKGIEWSESNKIEAQTAISYPDVVATVALLKRGYAQGAKWAMNNATLYKVFYGMVDDHKRPIFIADPRDDAIGRILGFDVVVDDHIADNTIYFGNFSRYLAYNMPQGITVESSADSSFKAALIDYRALCVCDCKPIVKEAFVKLTVASEAA